jgi:hypothetical protein
VEPKHNKLVMNFHPINEPLSNLKVKGRFFNYSLINIHAPTNDSGDDANNSFYEELKRHTAQIRETTKRL